MNRLAREIYSLCMSDRMILNYPELKSEKNKVNLHYYHAEIADRKLSETSKGFVNLGDYLSKIIVDYMLEKKGLSLDRHIAGTKHLYAIGCILLMGYQDATIWGSSFPFEPGNLRAFPHRFRKLDVRCVRGPKTRQTLLRLGFKCPEVYGDPAVLMPLIYQPKSKRIDKDFVIIPHYSMVDRLGSKYQGCVINMATDDYRSVIDAICSAKYVISSSLHGIILAEAYGISAVFYQDRDERFNYKYVDYYMSTFREFRPCHDIEEALSAKIPEVPDLTNMRLNLINTFPYDLWSSNVKASGVQE